MLPVTCCCTSLKGKLKSFLSLDHRDGQGSNRSFHFLWLHAAAFWILAWRLKWRSTGLKLTSTCVARSQEELFPVSIDWSVCFRFLQKKEENFPCDTVSQTSWWCRKLWPSDMRCNNRVVMKYCNTHQDVDVLVVLREYLQFSSYFLCVSLCDWAPQISTSNTSLYTTSSTHQIMVGVISCTIDDARA